MKFESARSAKGNIGVSWESQEAADAQAAAMDAGGNTNCYGCSNCRGCSYCSGCSDCSDCSYCSGCSDCSYCSGCSGCSGCSDCSGCSYCSYCSDCSYCSGCSGCSDCSGCSYCSGCSDCSGVLIWRRGGASELMALNGLTWPVAVSESRMQIGCQNHSHEDWANFSDERIAKMAGEALDFWRQWKPTLMAMCAHKAATVEKEPA